MLPPPYFATRPLSDSVFDGETLPQYSRSHDTESFAAGRHEQVGEDMEIENLTVNTADTEMHDGVDGLDREGALELPGVVCRKVPMLGESDLAGTCGSATLPNNKLTCD